MLKIITRLCLFLVGTLAPATAETVSSFRRDSLPENYTGTCDPWLMAQSLNAGIIKSGTDVMDFPHQGVIKTKS